MRADRLLSILLHLQVHRRLTAGELARRLEVSERTIYRDMEALGMAGIPVVADRGARGGWRLLDDYRTNLTGLNEAEIQALFLAKPVRLLADLQLDKAAEGALMKLLAALPSARRGAQDLRQRIHVDVAGWRQTAEPVPLLPLLQEAVWRDRRIRMTYGRTDGTSAEREVDPLGLVAKGSVWYLVAAVEGEPRTYRVSRIREAVALDQPCTPRPADFDLAAYWDRSAAQFQANIPRFPAVVRVDPAILPRARGGERYTRVAREDSPGPNGWIPLTILFEDGHTALEWALSFGPQVEVVEPADLRAAVIAAAEGIVARYATGAHAAC